MRNFSRRIPQSTNNVAQGQKATIDGNPFFGPITWKTIKNYEKNSQKIVKNSLKIHREKSLKK